MAVNRPSPPTNPTNPLQLVAGRRDWRVLLEQDYQAQAERLVAAYERTLAPLRARASALLAELQQIEAATGQSVSLAALHSLNSYTDLISRIGVEMNDFAAVARFSSAELSDQALLLGLQGALDAASAQSAGLIGSAWMRPDPEALGRLIGYVDSEAMRQSFAQFGTNAAQDFADLMISLTAQGKGSREIARAVDVWLNVPFAWAENIARTTQAYSYRGATAASYQANAALLDGWMWVAALDVRTCLSCIAQHGSIHPVSDVLNDHHRGRCTMVPLVKGSTWARAVESGRDWFGRLPEGTQRVMAGDLLWTALREGDAAWSDLSKTYHNDVFGEMLREASVKELISDPLRYFQLGQIARGLPTNGTTVVQAAQIAAEARVR